MLFQEIVGATGAGCASTLVGHPLDTIKVHLQSNHRLTGTFQAAQHLLKQESPLVFFRGIAPPLVNAVLMNTVMFSVFYEVKQLLPQQDDNSYVGALTAGLISGVATACLSTPTDYIKIQSQLRDVDSLEVCKSILQQRNPLSILFRGHIPNLAREGVFTMVYLGLYDVWRPTHNANTSSLLEVAATSSLTGGLAWIASYPFDTIKTVIQGSSHKVTIQQAVRKLWKTGGFYKGCGASTGRAVLVTSIRMIVYEWILGLF